MTESQWLRCKNSSRMVEFLGEKAGERKMHLFWCACLRQLWPILEERSRRAVEIMEKFVDGGVSGKKIAATKEAARQAYHDAGRARQASGYRIEEMYFHAAAAAFVVCPGSVARQYAGLLDRTAAILSGCYLAARSRRSVTGGCRKQQAYAVVVLRHIFGNPFRPYPAPPSWPAPVIALAGALYHGEPCHDPLHDALLEAGHPELAEHFRDEDHPKGCWALDLILGKK